jgi:hypothetical protein
MEIIVHILTADIARKSRISSFVGDDNKYQLRWIENATNNFWSKIDKQT